MPKAFSYLRFSSVKQADGDSQRRQTSGAEAWARRKGIPLDTASYRDLGVSGWKGKNATEGALGAFLVACEMGAIERGDYLILENLDRLTRQNWRKALDLFNRILDYGITIVTLEPDTEYLPDDPSPFKMIDAIFKFLGNNEKSETLSSRLRQAWAAKRTKKEPMTSWCPAWIRLDEETGKYELIPEKAKIVRFLVKTYLGKSFGDKRLAKYLNDKNIPNISERKGDAKRVSHWTASYISKILSSPQLIGDYEPGREIDGVYRKTGEVWKGYFPKVIDEESYTRLRARRKLNTHDKGRKSQDNRNLFAGMIYNPRDKQTFWRIVKDMPRLISAGYRNGLGSDTASIPYDAFETTFLKMFSDKLTFQDLLTDTPEPPNVESLRSQLLEISARIEEAKRRASKVKDFSALLDLVETLQAEKQKIQEQLKAEESNIALSSREAIETTFGNLRHICVACHNGQELSVERRGTIRAKLRDLIESMTMLIYGKKRSKYKVAECSIQWRAGGQATLTVMFERETVVWAKLDKTAVKYSEEYDKQQQTQYSNLGRQYTIGRPSEDWIIRPHHSSNKVSV